MDKGIIKFIVRILCYLGIGIVAIAYLLHPIFLHYVAKMTWLSSFGLYLACFVGGTTYGTARLIVWAFHRD